MSHFSDDVHHRLSTRIRDIIPDFVESEYPAFVAFLKAYYEFLEQYDELPIAPTYTLQPGVVSVRAGNSVILGANTKFNDLSDIYANNTLFRVGSDTFRIRNIANNTQLTVYEIPIRSYFANTHTVEINKTTRQASGALRQILTFHQVEDTLDDFIAYFRETYLKDIPQGLTDTSVLLPRILDFYQARGSEASYDFLFRVLYGKDVKFSYPRESVFTTSDNEWVKPVIMRLDYATDTYKLQPGVVSVSEGNSVILGANTKFNDLSDIYTSNTLFRVGSDTFRIQNIANNTQLTVYEIPVRSYVANTHTVNSFVTGNVELLETREIIGLTSNARATVLQTVIAYEGSRRVVRMFTTEPIIALDPGGILLEDGSGQLIVTKFGVPPEGLSNIVYDFNLLRDEVNSLTFQVGETISTIPTNDPDAITGELVGTITGFTIESRGARYQLGDFVYPPSRFANGAVFTGGFGGVGKITAFTDVDLTQVNIDVPGLGYYAGLPLIVDNTGTGGGSGLSGYVSAVSPGNILLHADAGAEIDDGDILLFTDIDEIEYEASREKIDYYEVGISLADVFSGLQLNSDNLDDDGDDLTDEETGKQLLQESAIVLGSFAWSSNVGSAIYGANLATTIVGLTSNLSVFPVYVNGIRTEVGQVFELAIESFGAGYVAGLPSVGIQTPAIPTADATGLDPLTYEEIFGEAFDLAEVSVEKEVGQIGAVEVVKGGSGYANASFFVSGTTITQINFITEDGLFIELEDGAGYLMFNDEGAGYAATSSTLTGNGAKLALTLGAISRGEPYFRNTRSFGSADQYVQDITKYQPFSYVLTVEEDLSRYATALRRLVHPAGGLLLPRQTITSDIDLDSLLNLEGIDYTFLIEENLASDPPSIKTIYVTAPAASLALALVTTFNGIDITAPTASIIPTLTIQVSSVEIAVVGNPIQLNLIIPFETNTLTLRNEEETTELDIPVASTNIDIIAPIGVAVAIVELPTGLSEITIIDALTTIATTVTVSSSASTLTISNDEETTYLAVPVATNNITETAPTTTLSTQVTLVAGALSLTISAAGVDVSTTVDVATNTASITLTNDEETTYLAVPVSSGFIAIAAPPVTVESGPTSISANTLSLQVEAPNETIATIVGLSITFDTIVEPYETTAVTPYENTILVTFVDWEAPPIRLSAPNVTIV